MNKYARTCLSIALMLAFFGVAAQKKGQDRLDSLMAVLPNAAEDTSKVNLLVDISITCSNISVDDGLKYGNKALELAENMAWQQGIANADRALALNYHAIPDFPQALAHFLKAYRMYEALDNKRGVIKCVNAIAALYQEQSDFAKALEYDFLSLKINEEAADKAAMGANYSNIGLVYQNLSDYPNALEYDFKSLKIHEELGDKDGIARSLGSIGVVFQNQADYPKAINYFTRALKICEEIGFKRGIGRNYTNLAIVYEAQSNLKAALEYDYKALSINEEVGNKQGYAKDLNNIGLIYRKQSDFGKSLEILFQALQVADQLKNRLVYAITLGNIGETYLHLTDDVNDQQLKKILSGNKLKALDLAKIYTDSALVLNKRMGDLNKLKDNYQTMSKIQTKLGDVNGALENYKKYVASKDSVYNTDKDKRLTQLSMQYEFNKIQDSIRAAQSKMELMHATEWKKQKVWNIILIGFSILLLLVGWLLYNRFKLQKKVEQQRAIIEERQRIGSEMHDDLGSGLSKISLLSQLLQQNPSPSEAKVHLDKITQSTEEMIDKMGEIVWALSAKNDTLENLVVYIRQYAMEFFDSTPIECKVLIPDELPEVPLDGELRRKIFLVVKEALHNVLKHSAASKVEINFVLPDGKFEILISDNGKGIDLSSISILGNGLQNMKKRMEDIGGVLEIKNMVGTSIKIQLPIAL
ncbi:MAG: tetratricopeptide repeat protein [Bacteroidota bacterium]